MLIKYEFSEADWNAFLDWKYSTRRFGFLNIIKSIFEMKELSLRILASAVFIVYIFAPTPSSGLATQPDLLAQSVNLAAHSGAPGQLNWVVMAMLCALLFLVFRCGGETARIVLEKAKSSTIFGTRTFSIEKDLMSDKGALYELSCSRWDITDYEESEQFFCIYHGFPNCIVIPKRFIKNEDLEEIRKIAKERKSRLGSNI